MAEFAVWAPHAKTVTLCDADVHRPVVMERQAEWWRALAPVHDATQYAFSLDGGPPIPDPRSCSQPGGVHEKSQVVDHARFRWTDENWAGFDLNRSVIYELHVGTFTPEGTFDSAIKRLDYLSYLGIGAIEIMPVAEFPGTRGWGYDGVCLYAPHHSYGGPDGLKRLVDACHERDIGVIMDVVYNHLGPDGNYLGAFGPYFTDRHQTPWGNAVNFDGPDDSGVREFVLNNALMWLDCYHVDGLRLDAVHAIYDDSKPHIIEELARRCHALGRTRGFPAWVIAESDLNDPQVVRPPSEGGWGVDAQWSDDFHHALHALVTGEREGYYVDFGPIEDLAKTIREGYFFTGQFSKFFDRDRGFATDGVGPKRFVVCAQNHDQIGNRARGDRLSTLTDFRMLDVVAATVVLGPSIPMLFQGEEWGASTPFLYFTDHQDAELAAAVTEGRKREFASEDWGDGNVPDPQSVDTFKKSKLDWSEKDNPENARLLEWYRTLIRLRREKPDFSSDDRRVEVSGDVLTMHRGDHCVIANFGRGTAHVGSEELEPMSVKIVSS